MDANLLLYAYDGASPHHESARTWWEQRLSGDVPVWLCWPTVLAFVRISTNRRLLQNPLSSEEALAIVDSWIERANVEWTDPGDQHWSILKGMIREGQAAGPLVTDAHLAALALERGAVLYSTDRDFARFPGLRFVNPLD